MTTSTEQAPEEQAAPDRGALPSSHRRLFAQEFTTQLQRIGSASLAQMVSDYRLKLFKIPANHGELREAADDARRFGWVQAPE